MTMGLQTGRRTVFAYRFANRSSCVNATLETHRARHEEKKHFYKKTRHILLYFYQLTSVRCVNFNFANKTMAVRSAKCHFVSEQQLVNSISRNRHCFNYCNETWMTSFAVRINSYSMFEMSIGCIMHAWNGAFCRTTVLLHWYGPWGKSAQIACRTFS